MSQLNEILSFEDFKKSLNEKKKDQQYSSGCIMGYFEKDFGDPKIKEKDIYNNEEDEYGLEVEPHVTVLYGLTDSEIEENDIVTLFNMIEGPVCETSEISLFENEKFDVVKWDIKSDELNMLNKMLTVMFPFKSDYPDYHAHCTIAYCLPGSGSDYKKELKKPKKQKIAYWVYSQADGRKIKITPGKGMSVIRKSYPTNESIMTEADLLAYSSNPQICTGLQPNLSNDKSFEYKGYTVKLNNNGDYKYYCNVYLSGVYKMGIKGPASYDKAKEAAINFIDGEIDGTNT